MLSLTRLALEFNSFKNLQFKENLHIDYIIKSTKNSIVHKRLHTDSG